MSRYLDLSIHEKAVSLLMAQKRYLKSSKTFKDESLSELFISLGCNQLLHCPEYIQLQRSYLRSHGQVHKSLSASFALRCASRSNRL